MATCIQCARTWRRFAMSDNKKGRDVAAEGTGAETREQEDQI